MFDIINGLIAYYCISLIFVYMYFNRLMLIFFLNLICAEAENGVGTAAELKTKAGGSVVSEQES
jgi:hypothetical protein